MFNSKTTKFGFSFALIGLLNACGSASFDGEYAINKDKTLNSPAMAEAREMSPMVADVQKMMLSTMLSAIPKMKVADGEVKLGMKTCELSFSGDVACGESGKVGVLSKTDDGVVLTMEQEGEKIDLFYDAVASK